MKDPVQTGEETRTITARVLSFREGLETYDHVDMIRIKSSRYNLLILKDYMPTLGEVENGRVEIVCDGRAEVYDEVNGYFIHSSNEFELLITEDDYVG